MAVKKWSCCSGLRAPSQGSSAVGPACPSKKLPWSLDIAQNPEAVSPADIVILNRVVCCYPDYAGLLSAAGNHARSLLILSYPRMNPLTWVWLGIGNWLNVVRGREFRAYLHDPAAMLGIPVRNGLRLVMEHHGPTWSIARFERQAA